ncbi:response regulator [Schlegelella sp. S2-27]|uniref:Response regulator n=1 Tax=Caldimonas mangrovi TaxID=2944811 RepID=A0ABT0YPC9_9BURK|nr:response regulator [Caldimonas mangrovi]MCM5680589.1 response regulator [Caldimonas mangrovi]
MQQPAAIPTVDAPAPRVHAPLVRPSVRRLALVVEDNPVNQLLAEEMLKRLGFEVALAADGVEALEACQRNTPDIVLMDIQMPRMDGFDATRQLRLMQQAGLLRRFPIIAVTACGTSRQQCLDAGMDGYIPKPLDLASIGRQLQEVAH